MISKVFSAVIVLALVVAFALYSPMPTIESLKAKNTHESLYLCEVLEAGEMLKLPNPASYSDI